MLKNEIKNNINLKKDIKDKNQYVLTFKTLDCGHKGGLIT